MNDAIRAAAGRGIPPELAHERPIGDAGIGRGGAAGVRPRPTTSAAVNERLRAAMRLQRGFLIPGGIHLDDTCVELDHLLGRR